MSLLTPGIEHEAELVIEQVSKVLHFRLASFSHDLLVVDDLEFFHLGLETWADVQHNVACSIWAKAPNGFSRRRIAAEEVTDEDSDVCRRRNRHHACDAR